MRSQFTLTSNLPHYQVVRLENKGAKSLRYWIWQSKPNDQIPFMGITPPATLKIGQTVRLKLRPRDSTYLRFQPTSGGVKFLLKALDAMGAGVLAFWNDDGSPASKERMVIRSTDKTRARDVSFDLEESNQLILKIQNIGAKEASFEAKASRP